MATDPDVRHPGGEGTGLVAGFGLLFEGCRWLRRERSLWALAVVPLVFSVVLSVAAIAAVVSWSAELHALIAGLFPALEADAWYAWLWVGPVRALFWLLTWIGFLAAGALSLLIALLVANVAASPFLDALAWRVERLHAGHVVESEGSGAAALLGDAWRSIAGEARRTGFFLLIWLALVASGFVIPGAHLVTGPLSLAITILFLPLEFSGYTLDRRRVPFRERRRWILGDWSRMTGFGAAAFLACFLPLLNLCMVPVLVVAGTLLVLQRPPQGGLA